MAIIPYSHKQFFRRMPNAQLAHYFSAKNIPLAIEFNQIKETDVDTIFVAFNELTADQQSIIEADFQDINALANEAGIQALIDESQFYSDKSFTQDIATIEGFHAKAMWAFLEKNEYWRGATMFLHADNVSYSFWKKRNDLPHIEPCVDDVDIEQFAKQLSQYFYKQQGRGKNCKVEPYRRYNKEYFFAYPEDYAQSGVEWVSNSLTTRSRHPAFEVIFVYCQDEGSLDIYAPRNSKSVPELQSLFAKCILKLDTLPDGTIDKRVYDLAPVEQADFEFQIEPESGIAEVIVTKLRLRLLHGNNRRITLEANTQHNKKSVYELLEELTIPAYKIFQVGLKVVFEPVSGKRANTRSFTISYPCSCGLGYDGNDLVIRNMLAASGIEPILTQG